MAHYRDAKLRIHRDTACCVVNADDRQTDPSWTGELPAGAAEASAAAGGAAAGVKRARAAKAAKTPAGPVAQASFSLSPPLSAPGFGMVRDGGLNWLVEALPDDEDGTRRRRGAASSTGFHLNRLMPADALRLHGAHNHANALAALTLMRAAGAPLAPMLRGLREFEAGPHRCHLVTVINDVQYYDDSKGTNVGATVAALSGLGRRCVLIAGGVGKGQDFAPLAPAVRRHARAVVLIGRDAGLIREALAATGVTLIDATSMEDAVAEGRRAGDRGRCGADVAGLRQLRHVPQLSASLRGLRRGGERPRARGGAAMLTAVTAYFRFGRGDADADRRTGERRAQGRPAGTGRRRTPGLQAVVAAQPHARRARYRRAGFRRRAAVVRRASS